MAGDWHTQISSYRLAQECFYCNQSSAPQFQGKGVLSRIISSGASQARRHFPLVITLSPQDPVQGMGSSICPSLGCQRGDFRIRAVNGIHPSQSRLVNLLVILPRDFQKAEDAMGQVYLQVQPYAGQTLPTETQKTQCTGSGPVCRESANPPASHPPKPEPLFSRHFIPPALKGEVD